MRGAWTVDWMPLVHLIPLYLMNHCRIRQFQSSAYFPIQNCTVLRFLFTASVKKIGITKEYFTLKPGDANGDRCNSQKTPDLIGKKQNWGIGCTHEVHFTTLFYSWACEEYYHVVVLGTSPVISRHKNLLECRMNSVHGFGYVTIWCRLWYGLVLRSWGSSQKSSQDSSDCCCSNHRCHRQLGLFQISEPQI